MDECSPYTTENGTDITISDRQNEFFNKNLFLCENNCTFKEYDILNKKSICFCQIKTEEFSILSLYNKTNSNIINFNSKENSGFSLLKCSYNLFSINGLKKNIAFYIILIIIVIFILTGIGFYHKGFNNLRKNINNILLLKEKKEIERKIPKVQNVENVDDFFSNNIDKIEKNLINY